MKFLLSLVGPSPWKKNVATSLKCNYAPTIVILSFSIICCCDFISYKMHLDSLYNILLRIKKVRCAVAFSWIVVLVEQLDYKELVGSGGAGRVRAAVLCCLCCYHQRGSEEAFCLPLHHLTHTPRKLTVNRIIKLDQ